MKYHPQARPDKEGQHRDNVDAYSRVISGLGPVMAPLLPLPEILGNLLALYAPRGGLSVDMDDLDAATLRQYRFAE